MTYKTWMYNGKFPLLKIFYHPFSVEILEHMLMLAIRIIQEQEPEQEPEHVRLIDIKRAMLEVEECYEIKDESLMLRAVARMKSMLSSIIFQLIGSKLSKQGWQYEKIKSKSNRTNFKTGNSR